MTDGLTFGNKIPSNSKKKDAIVIGIIGIVLISGLIYSYSIFTPIVDSDLPTINILVGGEFDRDIYTDCFFRLEDSKSGERKSVDSKIKLRGFTAADWAKKGYRLEFDKEISLLGMRKDDDWLLLAMYLDFPRMRIKLALDLWNSLNKYDPYAISPESRYVELYINGNYKGLYLLVEKNDRRLFGFDDAQNNVNSSFIFQAKIYSNLKVYNPEKWEQDWPNTYDGIEIMDEIMGDLINFIYESSDEDFYNESHGIFSKLDKTNVIDHLLFNFYINHRDYWHRNYFFVRNSHPSKIFFFPWDYDACFGQYGWLLDPIDDVPGFKGGCYLYKRLMNNSAFCEDLKERWEFLRERIFNKKFLMGLLDEIYEQIESILEIEMTIWKPRTVDEDPGSSWPEKLIYSTKEFNLEEYVNALYDFIPKRLKFCDDYFSNLT